MRRDKHRIESDILLHAIKIKRLIYELNRVGSVNQTPKEFINKITDRLNDIVDRKESTKIANLL